MRGEFYREADSKHYTMTILTDASRDGVSNHIKCIIVLLKITSVVIYFLPDADGLAADSFTLSNDLKFHCLVIIRSQ